METENLRTIKALKDFVENNQHTVILFSIGSKSPIRFHRMVCQLTLPAYYGGYFHFPGTLFETDSSGDVNLGVERSELKVLYQSPGFQNTSTVHAAILFSQIDKGPAHFAVKFQGLSYVDSTTAGRTSQVSYVTGTSYLTYEVLDGN